MSDVRIETLDIERFSTNTFEQNLRDIHEVYAQFAQLGLATVSSSRINTYRGAFESLKRAKEQGRLNLPLAVQVLHTLVEFAQLKTIVKAAVASLDRAAWDKQLRRLISGAGSPTPKSKHSPAHDFQFESYVAAVVELSGFSIRFAEPDVVVQNGANSFGIAAKRPSSKRKIEKHCRKAANQISRSGLPGIVALDVSSALYPDQCVNTNDLAGALTFVQVAANDFVSKNYHMLRDACIDDGVLGILVCLQLPMLNFGHPVAPQLGTTVRWLLVPCCDPGDERLRWILRFAEQCELGLFGPRDDPGESTKMALW